MVCRHLAAESMRGRTRWRPLHWGPKQPIPLVFGRMGRSIRLPPVVEVPLYTGPTQSIAAALGRPNPVPATQVLRSFAQWCRASRVGDLCLPFAVARPRSVGEPLPSSPETFWRCPNARRQWGKGRVGSFEQCRTRHRWYGAHEPAGAFHLCQTPTTRQRFFDWMKMT